MQRLLNISEAAEYLGVSSASLRKWSNKSLVHVYRTPGGQRRYSRADLEVFLASMREPPRGEPSGSEVPPQEIAARR